MPISQSETTRVSNWLTGGRVYPEVSISERAKEVLSQPNIEAELLRIVAASDAEPKLRVLAQEFLLEAGHPANPVLVETYCQTMGQGEESFIHNAWGFPGSGLARLGKTLVSYGETALPCLTRLLDENSELGYFGSEVIYISNLWQYRVCDLAAYFITQILNVSYANADSPAVRDQFIRELERRLPTQPDV